MRNNIVHQVLANRLRSSVQQVTLLLLDLFHLGIHHGFFRLPFFGFFRLKLFSFSFGLLLPLEFFFFLPD
jgi:hypothetical protein